MVLADSGAAAQTAGYMKAPLLGRAQLAARARSSRVKPVPDQYAPVPRTTALTERHSSRRSVPKVQLSM